MSWRFRKMFRFGPVRTTISKKGVGASWGIPGIRLGVSPDGGKYISLGIPGTGLYFIKYLSSQQQTNTKQNDRQNKAKQTQIKKNNQEEPWWKQKDL
ncbi:hypothetical protein GCM10027036_07620 [Flavihumibacter cheonanensis]|uniref:DUF4236 domain-containing protein n=1 Tax=Flavihumibacter cheonanensis TaxID=1442385 RepID=UPI001EF805E7|nr:DUF4236 domain-containing protein [Flavihumibacter cheonanensis]MCG7751793.1 DUF4236 domain-containing protein [Flavihumibacter cheonanensis]